MHRALAVFLHHALDRAPCFGSVWQLAGPCTVLEIWLDRAPSWPSSRTARETFACGSGTQSYNNLLCAWIRKFDHKWGGLKFGTSDVLDSAFVKRSCALLRSHPWMTTFTFPVWPNGSGAPIPTNFDDLIDGPSGGDIMYLDILIMYALSSGLQAAASMHL